MAKATVIVSFTNGHPNTAFPVEESADKTTNLISTAIKNHLPVQLTHVEQRDGSTCPIFINLNSEYILSALVAESSPLVKPPAIVVPQ